MPWHFGPFRLDRAQAELLCAEQPVPLRPKTLALLAYLVAHAGQMVTKAALLAAVWPETAVGDGVLKASVSELRKVFGDTPKASQWIATVHGRGYRFVAPVTLVEPAPPAAVPAPPRPPVAVPTLVPAPRLIARETELATLHIWYATALQGERQLGFITGEAGIGKTTLVDAFVAQLAGQTSLWVGQGQCIEQYGPGEVYLPLLEALGQLGRTADGPHLVARLRQQAPSWLLQLPSLLAPGEAEALQRATAGATRERMLRELAEMVEGLAAARPLLLVLEDLHWSDTATIEWLAYVARRRGPARLLVLGTYRPVEAIVRAHPVRAMVQDLLVHGQGAELPLGEWAEAGVAAYLVQRGGGAAVPAPLARALTARTEGSPLFLVAMVDALIRQGVLRVGPAGWELLGGLEAVTEAMPPSIRHLLEHQVAQLASADQALLAAASVAGVEFTVAAVAAGLQQAEEDVEAQCATLARQSHLVQGRGTMVWPDGTVTARYGFCHALYQELLYEQVPVRRRARWHQQIGTRLEAGYGVQAGEVAAALAEHFVRGQDSPRAVHYLHRAAENAAQRSAHREGVALLTRAVALCTRLPATPARAQHELTLQIALGAALMATQGYAAPEVKQTYARARVLCAEVGETRQLFPVLRGLCLCYRTQGDFRTARALGEQLDHLAQREAHDPTLHLEAHEGLGTVLFHLGEYAAARTHLEQGITLTELTVQQSQVLRYGEAPGVRCLAMAANTLWCLGYPTQAAQRSQEALALARELAHPHSLALAQYWAAFLHHCRREALAVQAQAEALLTLATAQGFPLWVGFGTFWYGWALAMQGQEQTGMAQIHRGVAAVLATGQAVVRPFYLVLLAEAAARAGQVEKGLRLLAEALTALQACARGDLLPEAYRLQGTLRLRQAPPDAAQAEACFQQALAVARRQEAKALELRAAMSLSRLWHQQGKREKARALLAPVYGWFTEGFDTADLQDAKALLEELGR